MLVPGVLTPEEYEKEMAEYRRQKELVDQQRQADAPMLARKEAALRGIIARYKGSPEADAAAICLVELLRANQFNFYIKHQTEEELEKEQPLGCYRRPFNTAMWSSVGWGHLFPEGSPLLPKRRNDKQSET
jgi:hypothetical protein